MLLRPGSFANVLLHKMFFRTLQMFEFNLILCLMIINGKTISRKQLHLSLFGDEVCYLLLCVLLNYCIC